MSKPLSSTQEDQTPLESMAEKFNQVDYDASIDVADTSATTSTSTSSSPPVKRRKRDPPQSVQEDVVSQGEPRSSTNSSEDEEIYFTCYQEFS